MGDKDMNAHVERFAALDPLYRLAMLRVDELQCEATRGREFRRAQAAGERRR
jgi:hypothetical protein